MSDAEAGLRISVFRFGNLRGRIVGRLDRADHVVVVDRDAGKIGIPALQHRAMKDRLDVVGEGRLVARLELAGRIERGNQTELAHPHVVHVVPHRDDIAGLRRIPRIAGDVPSRLDRGGGVVVEHDDRIDRTVGRIVVPGAVFGGMLQRRLLAVDDDSGGLGKAAGDDQPALLVDPDIAQRGQRPQRLVELVEVRRKALRIGRHVDDGARRVRISRGRGGVEGDHGRGAAGRLDGTRAGIDDQFPQPQRIVAVGLALVVGVAQDEFREVSAGS